LVVVPAAVVLMVRVVLVVLVVGVVVAACAAASAGDGHRKRSSVTKELPNIMPQKEKATCKGQSPPSRL